MIHAIQFVIVWACVVALILIASVVILAGLGKAAERAKRRLHNATLAMTALAAACMLFARKGTVTVDDPYIRNDGSYLTNDVAHVAIAKRSQILPDSTEILVYARPLDSTNVTDWVRLEPYLTFADHPFDYTLANATNYNVMVAARFVPEPIIHTNGVWQTRGFIIPGTNKAAFPGTKVIRKEDL